MSNAPGRRERRSLNLLICTALLCLAVSGCKSAAKRDTSDQPKPEDPSQALPQISSHVDPAALRADVDTFAFTFRSRVSSVASDIAHATPDREVRESAIRWKMQVIPAVDTARLASDPRIALAGVWAIVVRQRALLAGDFGQKSFGDQAETARQAATELEKQIVEIAARYLPSDRLDQVSAEMERLATEAPTIAGYDVTIRRERQASKDQKDEKDEKDPLSELLELPMMPLAVVGAIGDTPGEIRNFANVAAGFGETARNVPEQLRWQMELLLLESEEHPISRAAESVSQTARALQESIDRPDGPVNTVHETVKDALVLADKADATTARAENIVASIDGHAAALSQTASAWESTVHSVQDLLDSWEKSHPSGGPDEGGGLDLEKVSTAAEKTRAAASEARSLISDIQSADLRDKISQVGAASRESIDHAAERMDDVIARLMWSLGAVVILAAIAFTVSRIAVHHFTRNTV